MTPSAPSTSDWSVDTISRSVACQSSVGIYFVLKERFLYYFKQPHDDDALGTIDLGLAVDGINLSVNVSRCHSVTHTLIAL
jgi:hypothetical protein